MKKINLLLIGLVLVVAGFAQSHPDKLFFKDRLEKLSEENLFKTEGYYNWCSSIIKGEDGKYHLFYSRWPKKYTFLSWLTHSEVAHAVADSPTGPWKYKETVLQSRGKGHWDAITVHNPKIKKFDGKYYLYYVATNMGDKDYTEEELIETARVGYSHPNWKKYLRPNQRTGVAVANSINGPWKRMDQPLIEPSGPITTLTVNPAITQGKDGKYYLIVKGDKPNETRFIRNQAMAVSDSPVGPFVIQEKPVIDYLDTEDMSVWYDAKRDYFYGVFHAHSFIGMVSSPDGVNWKKATEYVLTPKKLEMNDGDLLVPDRLERPFVYLEDDEPQVLSLAVKKGDEAYIAFVPVKQQKRPVPNKCQQAWQEAELGAVFHYDLHVFDGKKYGQGGNRIDPVTDYQVFNPKNLDTDQWIKAIKDAGFTFAILTATHETGFALYQSDVNPYCMKALKFQDGKGDLVRDFVNSCRKYGIKPGIYLGIRWNSFIGVHDFKVNGEGAFRENRQKWYNQMIEGMVKEICTNYGELFEIWFDGGADHPANGAPDVLPIVQQYQPNCLFYHNKQLAEARWGGSESGTVAYPCWSTFPYYSTGAGESAHQAIAKNNFQLLKEGDPNGAYWMPAMSDAPLRGYNGRHEWFWEPGDEAHIFPVENLMEMYYKSVGRNSTLIMGLTPGPDGVLPEPDVKRLKEWGAEIKRRFETPVAQTKGEGKKLVLKLSKAQPVNHVIIQEDIALGERVRRYKVEGLVKGKWTKLCDGQSIGHKRIQQFDPVECSKIRLTVEQFDELPSIKNFAVYEVD
ncbi:alpha-L-fucosidase [Sunxiuqinia elliptica]|uniref:alpha-L-fucosidase n=1 Tax=Sunxiuqinia elliptica TaxID=655355 RepID=A0A4R6GL83_9BACT|nr:alpha-L-fucosidase [Sunxiuqinia elliptica]TDN95909.1 alpha-L-fucosidase [Sunxiuqinia elliptica]TDO67850.1 alpha-L-fucosidase [Sunxiuqinia elliptica]